MGAQRPCPAAPNTTTVCSLSQHCNGRRSHLLLQVSAITSLTSSMHHHRVRWPCLLHPKIGPAICKGKSGDMMRGTGEVFPASCDEQERCSLQVAMNLRTRWQWGVTISLPSCGGSHHRPWRILHLFPHAAMLVSLIGIHWASRRLTPDSVLFLTLDGFWEGKEGVEGRSCRRWTKHKPNSSCEQTCRSHRPNAPERSRVCKITTHIQNRTPQLTESSNPREHTEF